MKIRESKKQNGPPTSLASHADQSSPLSSDPRNLSVARVLGEAQGAGLVSLPEGPAGLSKTLFLPPPGPGAPGAGGVSLGMSPGQYGPGVSSQQRASWAQAAHTAPGLPNGDVCLGCGITRLPSTAPRVVAATARVPRPHRGSPAQLPLAFASGLCRLPPSSPPR